MRDDFYTENNIDLVELIISTDKAVSVSDVPHEAHEPHETNVTNVPHVPHELPVPRISHRRLASDRSELSM